MSLNVVFTPSNNFNATFYYYNSSCVYGTWNEENTGSCHLNYHIQYDDNDAIHLTTKTEYTRCGLTNLKFVQMWAAYNGRVGRKSVYSIDTTKDISTSRSLKAKGDCESSSNVIIGVIVTAFIVQILNIVFLYLWKRKGLKEIFKEKVNHQKNSTKENEEVYEVVGATVSNYTDLNLDKTVTNLYTGLTKREKENTAADAYKSDENMYEM
ncbi:uncharacterized protein LOC130636323 isoform X3 [Hydractinia symbiolongicarpus]|uniref:uncharacterized protein LOC130636323 isoform X3 n=1 Tax=Hydractinia symbiolongicarpus TaxID=13093 RepID=UPI0025505137|nr:uncharacterized protein LOC130636323 isoform X3 [Hydractinia symbiolongicarpus]